MRYLYCYSYRRINPNSSAATRTTCHQPASPKLNDLLIQVPSVHNCGESTPETRRTKLALSTLVKTRLGQKSRKGERERASRRLQPQRRPSTTPTFATITTHLCNHLPQTSQVQIYEDTHSISAFIAAFPPAARFPKHRPDAAQRAHNQPRPEKQTTQKHHHHPFFSRTPSAKLSIMATLSSDLGSAPWKFPAVKAVLGNYTTNAKVRHDPTGIKIRHTVFYRFPTETANSREDS